MSVKDIDLGWGKIVDEMNSIGKKAVKVGLQSGDTEKDGTSLAYIGSLHEYGSDGGKIPQRSFMRTAIDDNDRKIKSLSDDLGGKIIDGSISVNQALDTVGIAVTGMIQKQIVDGDFQSLKDSTVKAKGSDKPLIDTGRMRQSIRHVLE